VIPYCKAQACGNDFLIIESFHVDASAKREVAKRLCARNTGIGADGVEYFEWTGERHGTIVLYNADGSIAEISGNGTRCVAAWMAHNRGVASGASVRIQTDAGARECWIINTEDSHYQIASLMGVPSIEEHTVVLRTRQRIPGSVVSTGNPHFVTFVDNRDFSVDGRSWQHLCEEICHHSDFPHQTNVEFVRVLNENEIEIRIFERGVGPTTSSGTGTCASSAAAMTLRGMGRKIGVRAPGGTQQVEWSDSSSEMLLTGPADLVAIGEAW
jgi:diaminopimelate epimerase